MAGRSLPEMVQLTARVPRGEAGFWEIMLRLDRERGEFAVGDVEGESNVKPGAVAQYVRKLVKASFAKHVSNRPAPVRPAKVYKLLKRQKEAPRLRADGTPLNRSDRECLWCAIRSVPGPFTAQEVAYAATTTTPIRANSADRYIRYLAAAGYLAEVGAMHWRLRPKMNTGPLAPSILRVHAVFDRNLRKVMGDEHEACEVAP